MLDVGSLDEGSLKGEGSSHSRDELESVCM